MIHRNFALAAILLFAPLAHADPKDCAAEYHDIAQGNADRVKDRFQAHKHRELNSIERSRDWTRDYLMRRQGRYYPVLAMDDATPLKAKLTAKYALGEKTAFEGAPFDIEKVKKELSEMIAGMEKYPREFNAFLEDTARKSARLESMERALAESKVGKGRITLDVPITKVDDKGNLTEIGMQNYSWDNRAKFDLELKDLRAELKKRMQGPGLFRKEGYYTLEILDTDGKPLYLDAMEHINNLKKVETFRGEFRDLSARVKSEADPELKALMDRANNFYDAADSLKKEYRAPYWAWQRLRWAQLNAEIRGFALGIKVKAWDNESTQTMLKFIKEMDPEERRALGLDKMAKSVEFMGSNWYVRTLWAIGGGFVGTGTVATYATTFWQTLRSEATQKETCAASESDAKFRTCAQNYLQGKFTLDSLKEVLFDDDAFLNDAGKLKDPKVRAEVLDIFQRRLSYQKDQRSIEERKEALGKAIKDLQSEKDPTSDAFREKIITAPRAELFIRNLVSDTEEGRSRSYLEAAHPQQMKKHHDTALKILGEADPALRQPLLNELRAKGAESLAKDIESIIADREEYLADPARYMARKLKVKKPMVRRPLIDEEDGKDPKQPDVKRPPANTNDDDMVKTPAKKNLPSDERDDTN